MHKRLAIWVGLSVGCAHRPPPPPEPVRQTAAPVAPAPEPDEEIHVSGTLGSLNDDEISGPFQRRWDEITRCYTEAQSKLPYLGGKLEIKVRVGPSGDPKKVYVSASNFGNYEAEKCILQVAQKLTFSKPHGGNEAEFTYPLEFRQQRPVSPWDEARVQPALLRHKKDLSQCKAKSQNGLPAQLALTMYVAPGGKVASAGVSADAPLDDAFATCLVDKARLWRLDDPLGRIAKATVEVRE
jgi:hypothetical protein